MPRKAVIILSLITVLNVTALVMNITLPTRAAVGGMSYEDLMRDPDFTRAVTSVAEQCRVNVDIARLECGSSR